MACSGDAEGTGGDSGDDAADDQSRSGGSVALSWPLTGEPLDGALPDHPVVAVKVDNSSSSAPQLGLDAADIVTEQLVEGGTTRLAVLYYSQLPEVAGPVRSMRATDIGIVNPANAVLVASGGAGKTRARVDGAGIDTFPEGSVGYQRASDRPAPYNLMMDLPELVGLLEPDEPPPPYLPFGGDDLAGGEPAAEFDVVFSGGHTTSWRYAPNTAYTRPDSYAKAGADFVPDNVLVLRVKIGDAGYSDPAGNPVPETIYEGTGQAMLFSGGTVVEATWVKPEPRSPLRLNTRSGDPLQVPPGRTWIELAPAAEWPVQIGG